MDKSAKKQEIRGLIAKFLGSTDVEELLNLRLNILKAVASCGYDPKTSTGLSLAVETWGNDLTNYILAVRNNNVTSELRDFTKLSLAGLLNFVDLSTLPN